jgi:hypothetical protein
VTARRLLLLPLACLALCLPGAGATASPAPGPPQTQQPRSAQATPEHQLDRLERMITRMERPARVWRRWTKCLGEVPVTEYGDVDHRFGFLYDERNGTGFDRRPALAIGRGGKHRPNFVLFEFSDRKRCRGLGTEPTQTGTPGNPGTADPARPVSARPARLRTGVGTLERRLAGLERREARLERMSEQFDEWESCLSWIPVTEYGDPEGRYGYVYEDSAGARTYMPALAIDRSEWDDPDYMLLGGEISRLNLRRGGDEDESDALPAPVDLQRCNDEPGEAVDRPVSASPHGRLDRDTPAADRMDDLRQELDSFLEDVTDLGEPVQEFETFDQCMYLIGLAQHGSLSGEYGYVYGKGGKLRPALAMDIRGLRRPEHQFLAHPGEEPPSIECNEDAGGLFTN